MIEPKLLQMIKTQIFSTPSLRSFAILDGASVLDLPANLASFNPEHICLYRGELEPDLAEMAPYLVILEYNSPFTDWVLANGWGKHWGIYGAAMADLKELRRHFRMFLTVYDKDGKSLYFRYYDPRVWQVYLPSCNSGELNTVFGPVVSYLVEDENPKFGRQFVIVDKILREDKILLG
jgi:hypothetical protein